MLNLLHCYVCSIPSCAQLFFGNDVLDMQDDVHLECASKIHVADT